MLIMDNKFHFYILLFILFVSFPLFSIGQTNSDWQSIFLTPGGGNIMDGVEASFQVNTCNGEDIIYVCNNNVLCLFVIVGKI